MALAAARGEAESDERIAVEAVFPADTGADPAAQVVPLFRQGPELFRDLPSFRDILRLSRETPRCLC